jgi:hypothetical protein
MSSDSDNDWLDMEVEEQQRQQAGDGDLDPHLEEIQRLMDLAEEEDEWTDSRHLLLPPSRDVSNLLARFMEVEDEKEAAPPPPPPRYNPVELLMKLPCDLRAFVKTFWTYTRQPLHVDILQNSYGTFLGPYLSACFTVTGLDNAPDRFTVTRAVTMRQDPTNVTTTTLADQTADQVGLLVTQEWIKYFIEINNVRRTSHSVTVRSLHCCPKHDNPMSITTAGGGFFLSRGSFRQPRHPLPIAMSRYISVICADAVARMLTHWTACSDDMDELPMEADPTWSMRNPLPPMPGYS